MDYSQQGDSLVGDDDNSNPSGNLVSIVFDPLVHLVTLRHRNTVSSSRKSKRTEEEMEYVEKLDSSFSTPEDQELDESEHSLHVTPKKSSILDPAVAKMESAKRRDEEEERQRESEIRKRRQQKTPKPTKKSVSVTNTTTPKHVEESEYSETSSIHDPEPNQHPPQISLDVIFLAVLIIILCILGYLCCRGLLMVRFTFLLHF